MATLMASYGDSIAAHDRFQTTQPRTEPLQ